MKFSEVRKKYFKSTEEVVSMFLGLVIVLVVGVLIFNYFQRNKGVIDIPGSSDIKLTDSALDKLSQSEEKIYQVVKGDSLWKIAVREYGDGYQWTKIAMANDLKNASIINIGQRIVLPKLEMKKVTENQSGENRVIAEGSDYKVVKGDSLWKIAVKSYGDGYQWTKIWQTNKTKLLNPNGLEIGMILNIPKLN